MGEVFRAGVEPGGLTNDYEIKVLICYMLRELGGPVPVSVAIEVFVESGIGNYFEAASAAAGLVSSGHLKIISQKGEKCYQLTEVGENAAATFEKDLPRSVRDKAVDTAKRLLVIRERRAHNHVSVQKAEDGYLLTLTISDIGSDLLSITILLPDRKCCDEIQERFLQDPVVAYKGVVAVLTGSFENVGELLDTPETGAERPAT